MKVPVLRQGEFLIASLQEAPADSDWKALRTDLLERVGRFRSKGVVIDVSALDVMDSFATRALDGIAAMLRLRGAETAVVGVQPGVAFAMAQLGLRLGSAATALDLEAGLVALRAKIDGDRNRR